jgi:DNA-directed RNA polymerase I, II, and III subunit RPABC2
MKSPFIASNKAQALIKQLSGNKNDSELNSESESDSGTESELESELESDLESVNNETENPENKPDVIKEDESEDIVDTESEKEEEEEEVEADADPQTEYNEDGPNEKDTENNNNDDDDCLFQYDDLIEDKDSEHQAYEIPKNERMTDPRMTHYEKVRLLGIRSKQISMGAKVMVKYDNNMGAVELAKYELNNKTTPLTIKRPLPDNSYELWKVSELQLDDNDNDNNNISIIIEIESTFNKKKNKYDILI